jgi:hypothetical protein
MDETQVAPAATPPVAPVPTPPADAVAGEPSAAPVQSETQQEPQQKPDETVEAFRKRMNQHYYELRQARRAAEQAATEAQRIAAERDQAKRELDDFRRRSGLPRPEQFQDLGQYQQAVEAYYENDRQTREQIERQAAQAAQAAMVDAQINGAIEQRFAEGTQRFPDYREVVGNQALPPLRGMNPPLFAAILKHPRSVEISYYLGKNPGEAYRLAGLDPLSSLTELGALVGKLPNQERRQASTAPAPPAEVGSGERAAKDPSRMTDREFAEWRRKQIQARGGR